MSEEHFSTLMTYIFSLYTTLSLTPVMYPDLPLQVGGSGLPVYVGGGPREVLLYRGVMMASVVGIGVTLFSIYRMATGQMTKKGSS